MRKFTKFFAQAGISHWFMKQCQWMTSSAIPLTCACCRPRIHFRMSAKHGNKKGEKATQKGEPQPRGTNTKFALSTRINYTEIPRVKKKNGGVYKKAEIWFHSSWSCKNERLRFSWKIELVLLISNKLLFWEQKFTSGKYQSRLLDLFRATRQPRPSWFPSSPTANNPLSPLSRITLIKRGSTWVMLFYMLNNNMAAIIILVKLF